MKKQSVKWSVAGELSFMTTTAEKPKMQWEKDADGGGDQ